MSSRLDTANHETLSDAVEAKKPRKRSEFESETSADEGDTDNEMTFIRAPRGRGSRGVVEGGATLLDVDDSDSENESGLMDKLANAIGHLFTE